MYTSKLDFWGLRLFTSIDSDVMVPIKISNKINEIESRYRFFRVKSQTRELLFQINFFSHMNIYLFPSVRLFVDLSVLPSVGLSV